MAGPHPASRGFATRFGPARSVLNFALLAVLPAACASAPVGADARSIRRRQASEVCALAAVGGVLAYDTTYGLGFKSSDHVRAVVWPYGYSARREQDGIVVLIDSSGRTWPGRATAFAAAEPSVDYATCVTVRPRSEPVSRSRSVR